jgi:hypothetical protein
MTDNITPLFYMKNKEVQDTFLKHIKKNRLPYGFWRSNGELNIANIRKWCDWYSLYKQFKNIWDWYNVTTMEVNKNGGSGFLTSKLMKESIYELMQIAYPEYIWKPYKFKQSPQGYYNCLNNRWEVFQDFCNDYLRKKNEFENFDYQNEYDLYKLKLSYFENTEYYGCVRYYTESLINMLKDFMENNLLPKINLKEWNFIGQTQKKYWGDGTTPNKQHIERCFNIEIIQERGFDTFDKMYGLTQPIISDTGLKSPFTNYFNGSPIQLLEFLYPDNNWLFWEFVSAPNNAWDIYENQRKFMDYIMKDKSISYLPNLNVRQDLPHGLTMKFNCLFELAKTIYPEIAWNKNDFDKNNKTQKWLNYCLNKADFIFSNEIPICNSLKKSVFRMDIYLEQINTIIEIDGVQHFEKVDYFKTSVAPEIQQNRDIYKIREIGKKGIRTIRIYQPDLVGKDYEWFCINILPLLIKKNTIEPEFIVFNTKKSNIYNNHKELYNSNRIIQLTDCY